MLDLRNGNANKDRLKAFFMLGHSWGILAENKFNSGTRIKNSV